MKTLTNFYVHATKVKLFLGSCCCREVERREHYRKLFGWRKKEKRKIGKKKRILPQAKITEILQKIMQASKKKKKKAKTAHLPFPTFIFLEEPCFTYYFENHADNSCFMQRQRRHRQCLNTTTITKTSTGNS